MNWRQRLLRLATTIAGIALVTGVGYLVIPSNATAVGFAYLLYVLIIASTWGFLEAFVASAAATLTFNFYFLPPVREFTIADPQNWIGLISFLLTSLIASRLSAKAKRRTQDALSRQRDLERLYSFSRSILLIDDAAPFPKQLAQKLSETFDLSAVVLYDRRTGEICHAGPVDLNGIEERLRDVALQGTSHADHERQLTMSAVRLGSGPIASICLQGPSMPDSVLQGIANLIAIGLERARAQDLAKEIEAARRSEQLRTTLLDAMAHDLKTPLTSIRAATTALLSNPAPQPAAADELIRIADEEASRLEEVIDDALDLARLDMAKIDVQLEMCGVLEIVSDVVSSMKTGVEDHPIEVHGADGLPPVALDRRLLKLAVKQLLDNAVKYTAPGSAIDISASMRNGSVALEVTDSGPGIPLKEQHRIFERFYRSPAVQQQVPGSGLGLSIAHRIAEAHGGNLTVDSNRDTTTFRMTLPMTNKGGSV